jgi:hypothetical protein
MVLVPESAAALLAMSAIVAQLLVAGRRKHQATRRLICGGDGKSSRCRRGRGRAQNGSPLENTAA